MSEKPQTKDEKSKVEKKEAKGETKEAEGKKVKAEEKAEEETVEKPKPTSPTRKDTNVVYIGNKPPMDYVMAVITAFNMGNGSDVILKARGRAISTAVDVAEITRNRFLTDAKMRSISIGTEQITPREGGNPRNVSTMEISLKRSTL
jgi:DNA-binding protein